MAKLSLTGSVLTCNAIDIDVEAHNIVTGKSCSTGSYELTDSFATSCVSCAGESAGCRAQETALEPAPK